MLRRAARHILWCRVAGAFAPAQTNEAAVEAAARRVLLPQRAPPTFPRDGPSFARALEVLSANLCEVHAFKPPNVLERHAHAGGAPKPDCVEMLLRELFDLLLYDPELQLFDVRRLPQTATRALREHYERRNTGELPAASAGAAWFPICQEHDHSCRYLSTAPNGARYELHPSLSNLAAAAGVLLGQRGLDSLGELRSYWNDVHVSQARREQPPHTTVSRPAAGAPLALQLDESRSGTYRPQLSDHSRMREIAEMKLDGGRFAVEFRTP